MRDSRKLMTAGAALFTTCALFLFTAEIALRIVREYYQYHSKPRIELVKPPAPACKICHCGKTLCHVACGEENMYMSKCEGLCQKHQSK